MTELMFTVLGIYVCIMIYISAMWINMNAKLGKIMDKLDIKN